jgi:hypothetical protein
LPAVAPAFEVETFEYVEAGPALALVRLAGRWRPGAEPGDAELFALAGGGSRTALDPLPAPPGADDLWRAAFSAAPELLRDAGARFELVPAGGGEAVALPAPVEHGAAAGPATPAAPAAERRRAVGPESVPAPAPHAAAEPARPPRLFGRRRAVTQAGAQPMPTTDLALRQELAAERARREAAERIAAEQRERAERAEEMLRAELSGTLGQAAEVLERLDGYEHERRSFEQELDAIRHTHEERLAAVYDELEAVRAELGASVEQLNAAHEQLDTVHEAHSMELTAARSQRDAAIERQHGLEEQLAAAHADVDALHALVEDREGLIEQARGEAAHASGEAAEMQAAAERLRDAIVARTREAERRQSRRFARDAQAHPRAQAPMPPLDPQAREELRAGLERVAELERQAESLREAIRAQLPGGAPSPLQETLPLDAVGAPPPPATD